jgi:hypothetical protein
MGYKSSGLPTPQPPLVQYVGVDHGGGRIRMALQLLDGANVIAGLQQRVVTIASSSTKRNSMPEWKQ